MAANQEAPPHAAQLDQDESLLAAAREYLAAVEAGQPVDRKALLERHKDVAGELRDWLEGMDFVGSAVDEMHAQHPAGAKVEAPAPKVERGLAQPLGDFRLVRQIGQGGMGIVYEAIQLSLGRRVAVKVLPLAAALDSRHLQRFKNEAHAAAQLHHTNIVPVYAIGCDRSVHYYAMQLIEGQSLAAVIRQLRRAVGDTPAAEPSSPRWLDLTAPWSGREMRREDDCGSDENRCSGDSVSEHEALARQQTSDEPVSSLSTLRCTRRLDFFRLVARLGMQAAEALDYAHRQGVVHRDIKPENLLLDDQANVWITDFGLAQFYDDANLTQTGAMVGTLRYMSPEQASGKGVILDQRTDVYSLGMTLYELLTLKRALPGETRAELLGQIQSFEPRPARSVDRTIPAELEIILAKATAKEPADRYRSAGEFAEDLRRFLRDEPIRARPPSTWERTVKWTRRHKAVAASVLVILLLATVGSLISTAMIAREQAKTTAALVREQEQRKRAQQSFRQAREAVDSLARIAVQEMDGPQFIDIRRQMLQTASSYYQRFLEERNDDPSIAGELATAQRTVAAIHNEILVDLSAIEGFFRLWSLTELLKSPAVLDEQLHLAAGQKDDARALATKLRQEMQLPRLHDLMWKSPEEKREEVAALNREAESGLNQILTEQQATRLRQIARQEQGPMAFTEPDVAKTLKLTEEQLGVVRTIQADYRDSLDTLFRPRGEPPRHARSGQSTTIKDDAVARILDQLRPSQIEAWRKLCGDRVALDLMILPFPGPPPGPPPRR